MRIKHQIHQPRLMRKPKRQSAIRLIKLCSAGQQRKLPRRPQNGRRLLVSPSVHRQRKWRRRQWTRTSLMITACPPVTRYQRGSPRLHPRPQCRSTRTIRCRTSTCHPSTSTLRFLRQQRHRILTRQCLPHCPWMSPRPWPHPQGTLGRSRCLTWTMPIPCPWLTSCAMRPTSTRTWVPRIRAWTMWRPRRKGQSGNWSRGRRSHWRTMWSSIMRLLHRSRFSTRNDVPRGDWNSMPARRYTTL